MAGSMQSKLRSCVIAVVDSSEVKVSVLFAMRLTMCNNLERSIDFTLPRLWLLVSSRERGLAP